MEYSRITISGLSIRALETRSDFHHGGEKETCANVVAALIKSGCQVGLVEDEQWQRTGGGYKAGKFRFLLFL
jgi:hypothetical protein